jgi:hypothetical protein
VVDHLLLHGPEEPFHQEASSRQGRHQLHRPPPPLGPKASSLIGLAWKRPLLLRVLQERRGGRQEQRQEEQKATSYRLPCRRSLPCRYQDRFQSIYPGRWC